MLRDIWRALQRYPRLTIVAAALLLFVCARRVVDRKVETALNFTDRSQDEMPGCTSENTCRGHWEVMDHD